MRILSILALSAICMSAQINAPQIGFVRDRASNLRPVLGSEGSFVLGDVLLEGVLSAGCGRSIAYAKTDTELVILQNGTVFRKVEAPTGPAAFQRGSSKEIESIYFTEARELWVIRGAQFEKRHDVDPPASELSVERDQVYLRSGIRLKIPEVIVSIEWLNDKLAVARGQSSLYVFNENDENSLMQIPEGQ